MNRKTKRENIREKNQSLLYVSTGGGEGIHQETMCLLVTVLSYDTVGSSKLQRIALDFLPFSLIENMIMSEINFLCQNRSALEKMKLHTNMWVW
jgi:hypothetical protein